MSCKKFKFHTRHVNGCRPSLVIPSIRKNVSFAWIVVTELLSTARMVQSHDTARPSFRNFSIRAASNSEQPKFMASRNPMWWQLEAAMSRKERDNGSLTKVLTKTSFAPDTTVRRSFTSDEMLDGVPEPGLLITSGWTRPVMFFWSIQDFVLGLRDALLGHEYLVQIGILHRDVSENNILLALYPGEIRGYITDFDMAIPYQAQDIPSTEEESDDDVEEEESENEHAESSHPPNSPPAGTFKAERTGTTPYMSINVLDGRGHTHHDDIESFIYVMVLFFLAYKRPLPEVDLVNALSQGYVHDVTNGPRPHVKDWPDDFQAWNGRYASDVKFTFLHRTKYDAIFKQEVKKYWKNDKVSASIEKLVKSCRALFRKRPQRRVSHQEFISALDKWLKDNPVPPEGYNSCPFIDCENKQLV